MSVVVQKFGGTSVASADKIRRAATRAVETMRAGHQVVVVVSARGKKTDELVGLAAEMTNKPSPREMDVLLSTGEQETIALMSMAIHELGEKAISMTGGQIGMMTDESHTKARVKEIRTERLNSLLSSGHIVVAAGFQGIDQQNDITTLGRGGSDSTATALAAVLDAELCEIYTDVEGVFTSDPRFVKSAQKMESVSYDEMLELASLGAGVMHSRSIEFAKKYQVPLRVRPSFKDGEGSLITGMRHTQLRPVAGVAFIRDEVRVTMSDLPDRPGVMSTIFEMMARHKVAIDLVVQDVSEEGLAEVSFTVPQSEFAEAMTAAQAAIELLKQGNIRQGTNLAKVSIVGAGMPQHTGVAAKMFQSLADHQINVEMITTSEIKVSVLIDRDKCDEAATLIHDSFGLNVPSSAATTASSQPSDQHAETLAQREAREKDAVLGLASMEDIVVSEVVADDSQSRITLSHIPDQAGIAAQIFQQVAEAGISVDLIVQNVSQKGITNISFTIPTAETQKCLDLLSTLTPQWEGVRISHTDRIGKLSVAGIGLRSHTGVGEKLFNTLAEGNINVQMIGTSEVRMTIVIGADQLQDAQKRLCECFDLKP